MVLAGWRCDVPHPRGTVLYLHGIADNRASAAGVIARLRARGFSVRAYDSRAHGESGGDVCTYGYYEKDDVRREVDAVGAGPIILIGTSLGAAVALQEAADDSRISGLVAAEVFSDLRTVATERAPRWVPQAVIDASFEEAEREGHFRMDAVSPAHSAARVRIPVLLIHGAADVDTVPAHSQRVFAALSGPKELALVPAAHHNESLSRAWGNVVEWLDHVAKGRPACTAVPGARVTCAAFNHN